MIKEFTHAQTSLLQYSIDNEWSDILCLFMSAARNSGIVLDCIRDVRMVTIWTFTTCFYSKASKSRNLLN